MLTPQSIDDFLRSLAASGYSQNTMRAYRADLEGLLGWPGVAAVLDWRALEQHVSNYINGHRLQWSPKTLQRKLGTFRAWAEHAGCPFRLLPKYRVPTPAAPEPHPINEGIAGVLRMIASTRNPRHKALCALTGLAGLRVAEAVAVRPGHFIFDAGPEGEFEVSLRVRGKGDKERIVEIGATAWQHMRKAYEVATLRHDRLVPMTESGARKAIRRHGRNAGLSGTVASHDMRATFATAAYERTKDLRAVQELLGHANVKTTQVYTGVTRAARRTAAEVA